MGYLKDNMIEEMKLRDYSDASIKLYIRAMERFVGYFGRSPLSISQTEVRDYFVHLADERVSAILRKICYCSLKFFYRIHGQPHYLDFLPMPKSPRSIPEVLDEAEIQAILSYCRTLRHKFFFTLIYSSGLRISEALNLRVSDIDTTRMTIRVREAKNMKGRYTVLSDKAAKMLKSYVNRYRPESLLFFSKRDKSRRMPKRHTQQIFHNLVRQAGITKKVRVHTLRHSFATHLLERNTNLFYIMQLLGHASISSTLIYLHMRSPASMNIKSPLDLSDISLDEFRPLPRQPELCIA
jgi:site-specific recombinase XerD